MTTTLPALSSTTHIHSVTYDCVFGVTSVNSGAVLFMVPSPVRFMFSFETGKTQPDPAVDLWNVSTNSAWFDQSTEEASITGALNTICATIATLVGTTQAAIQATVKVQRTWRISPNQVGTAAPVQMPDAPVVYAETMPYPVVSAPAALTGTGTVTATGA